MKPLKFFRALNNEYGFSLTEVIVGGGILAGVALAGAKMFKDQKFAQKSVENEQKLAMLHNTLNKTMNISANCNATFKNAGITSGPIPANFQFNTLNNCGSNCKDTNNNGAASVANRNELNHKASDVGVGGPFLSRNSWADGTRTWYVTDMRVASATPITNSGPVIVRVSYKLGPDSSSTSGKTVNKDIIVHTRFFNNSFQECVNKQEGSINNLQNDFCKSINYQGFNTSGEVQKNGQFARWDEATQTCIMGTDKDCSQPGWTVDGVDSLGNMKCKPLQRGDDAVYLQDQAAPVIQCANPELRYENGKMRMVCP